MDIRRALLALSIMPATPAAVLEQGLFNLAPMQWYMFGVLLMQSIIYFAIAVRLTKWRGR